MFDSLKSAVGRISRRELFRRGSLLSAAPALASAATPAAAGKLQLGPDLYKSIGVRPVINCRGTLTVISGSLELPEVRAAVDAGGQRSRRPRRADGRASARRLAELTGRGVGAGVLRVRRREWRTSPPRASPAAIPTSTCAFPTSPASRKTKS